MFMRRAEGKKLIEEKIAEPSRSEIAHKIDS